jgi:threonylcarbamoyladenosine tRNA methylthiotransferase MtaB
VGRPAPTFSLKTLGCRVNQADSDEIVHYLETAGMDLVDFSAPADVVIVNTCTVTHVADRKSRQAIGRALRRSPEAELVITGCYASVSPEAVRAHFPGARVMSRVPAREVAAAVAESHVYSARAREFAENGFGERRRTRPTVKVQEGCRHGCAFCIVPRARGGPRSRPCGQVIERVEEFVRGGAAEVVLAGIALGSYRCPDSGVGLGELVGKVADRVSARIRLSSIEPMDFDGRICDLLGAGRICAHIHLPLQSGSAAVLGGMRRPYRPADYAAIIDRLRAADPAVAIGTDLMVGFPGESEGDHRRSLEFCARMGFSYMHVFPYSRRARTLAARRGGHVDDLTQRRRVREALDLAGELAERYQAGFVGSQGQVLWEEDPSGRCMGLTRNFLRVRPLGFEPAAGALQEVKLAAGDRGLVALPAAGANWASAKLTGDWGTA